MPNSNQSRKRARQTLKIAAHNKSRRSRLRTEIKKFYTAVEAADSAAAATLLRLTSSLLDKAAKTRLIHPNQAARRKSKMASAFNGVGKAPAK